MVHFIIMILVLIANQNADTKHLNHASKALLNISWKCFCMKVSTHLHQNGPACSVSRQWCSYLIMFKLILKWNNLIIEEIIRITLSKKLVRSSKSFLHKQGYKCAHACTEVKVNRVFRKQTYTCNLQNVDGIRYTVYEVQTVNYAWDNLY
jgi:hypothetical protein